MLLQRHDMTVDYDTLKPLFSDIQKEVSILKSLVEQQLSNDMKYHPMVAFISHSDNRMMAVTVPNVGTFEENSYALSEIMHLFPAFSAKTAIITMTAKIDINDHLYDLLNVFILSDDSAYILTLPYTHTQNNTFTWHDDISNLTNLADMDGEHEGADFISMLFVFTHMPGPVFTSSEILSYLSYKGYAIQDFQNKFSYFEMSPQ